MSIIISGVNTKYFSFNIIENFEHKNNKFVYVTEENSLTLL